jgi:hypothetical protein
MTTPIVTWDVGGPVRAEIFVIAMSGGRIRLGGPDGPRAWLVELGETEHPVEVVDRIVRDLLGEPLLVHSTSWRRDRGALVLTFLVVVDAAAMAGAEAVDVGRHDLARSSAHAAPAAIAESQVLEHALRHLAWLAQDDAVVQAVLSSEWHAALRDYVPEPFRALG